MILTLFFLCWGSFLNMLAYRLVHDVSIFKKRSFCTKCHKTIFWYDNIPIISWLFLKGKCRNCRNKISFLYPFIELFTTVSLIFLYYKVPSEHFFAYFIFFCALIVTLRTDIETMLISRYVTIFLIPLGLIFSYFEMLPISLSQSLIGSIFGFLILFLISKIFYLLTKKQGIGEGDLDLLAFIGSFTGVIGCWMSLLIGSIFGSLIGICLMIFGKLKTSTKIPFGPFLAIGTIIYVLFQKQIVYLVFP